MSKTIDVDVLAEKTGSIYEAVVILSKRSRQIASKTKSELDEKLSYFEGFESDVEDTRMLEEQKRISIDFETRSKPTEQAVEEMFRDEIYYRDPHAEG